ncbi:GH3 family domain-containing protein [Costertonia aggregata]|uniref:GH3 auxin-responsive promoter family protein n=1 Tax=Costertonia aggregata TaxID=343403 RepID=A0A7H9ANI5_9FLAO|nr:GH3 auxin-responsive promoter family protein [Costertonia aggregata]QLG44997.1 GH3 auxin-responsive promoter family protein [Costertonia aggregata]
MAILGNIIKGIIHASDMVSPDLNAVKQQKQVLKDLLESAQNTQFGKQYQFDKILLAEKTEKDFRAKVPFFDYDQIRKKWWHLVHKGEENITWPGKPDYFALSSGTTGKTSKRIPVTNAMIKSIRKAGIQQVLALRNFDLPSDFFEKEIMMLGSSTDLEEHNDALEGEISGISASNIPFWFQNYYKPGNEIAKIDDWDKRVQHIAEKAKEWDIGALSGIPSWMELMLQKVIEHHNAKNIHEIWPNLQVYTSGGVAFGPYEKSFNALLGKPITVIDTYLASEGFMAFQQRPETGAMKLVTNNGIYFEFIPFKPEYIQSDGSLVQDAPSLTIAEVELHQDYVLVISTVAGAWRYLIGDTIEFTDIDRAEIKITGRTKFFLNTVGSQLSVNKLNDAVKHLEQKYDIQIPEYTLCANRIEDDFYHSWYLGTSSKIDETQLAIALDDFLKHANKNYKVARSKALEGVKVNTILPSVFYDWNAANKKKGGQVKMERVMGEERFAEWKEFADNQG